MRKIYMNDMQQEVLYTGARDTVVCAGRGIGKGFVHAARLLQVVQAMPGCTIAYVAANAKRALSNTLPSMLQHLEDWGYKRGLHWVCGTKPPKNLNWRQPIIRPENWDNVVAFYTGAILVIISQDRKGTSNSKSFDFIDIDEAKFIDFEQLKDETFQANRGQVNIFGTCPLHHGMLITSDMPVTKKGSWFLEYKKKCDADLISTIQGMVYRQWEIKQQPALTDYLRRELRELGDHLTELRRHALFYKEYSSLVNIQVLGEAFVRQQKRDLPPLTFRTSILCQPIGIMQDGFYSSMLPKHKYNSTDFHYLDSFALDFKSISKSNDCRMDADLQPLQPLCIAFDFNANINWMVVGQTDRDQGRLNVLKSFYVKYERKLEALCEDFARYYQYHKTKEVVFYYDHTALGSNYAVNKDDFHNVIIRKLKRLGWSVRPVYIGRAMNHVEKHLLINRGFAGRAELMPYFNEQNNEDLLVSIQSAGVYNGKKDKRGEKLAETEEDRLEARTDGSDAFDTLFIGCAKFPQRAFVLRVTSGIN